MSELADAVRDDRGGGHDHDGRVIAVMVNERKVNLRDDHQTGRSIKEAAIKQGVPIQLDFVLSIEKGHGRTELVPDDKKIRVHPHDRFIAIPNDDNS